MYKGCTSFNAAGYAVVCTENDMYVLIDTENNATNEYKNVNCDLFSSSSICSAQEENGLWGIIDAKRDRPPVRRYLVKPQFEYVFECCGGYAAVKYNGKWGLIRINISKY